MSDNARPPYCAHPSPCEHVQACVALNRKQDASPPDESSYRKFDDAELIDALFDATADSNRYSDTRGGEWHRPTVLEASRRIHLIRNEMLRRMKDSGRRDP